MRLPDGVTGHYRQGFTVFEVDRSRAEYKGKKVGTLSTFDLRKFANLLIMTHPTERVKILYV